MALAGIGQGLSEGVKSYENVRDANEKKREKDAQLGLMGQKQGLIYNADAGSFDKGPGYDAKSPESVAARNRTRGLLNAIKPGVGDDAITDDWTARDIEDKQSHLNEFIKARTQKDPNAAFSFRDHQLAEREHSKLMGRIDRDPTLKQQLGAISNVRNATALTENAVNEGKPITKQQFADLQQTVLRNLGISGVQSFNERHAKELNSLGINADAAIQFLSGTPQDIGKDNPLYKHVKDMARWQSGSLEKQYQEQVANLTAGNEWIYEDPANKRLKAAFDNKINQLTKTVKGRAYTDPERDSGASGMMKSKATQYDAEKEKRYQDWVKAQAAPQ